MTLKISFVSIKESSQSTSLSEHSYFIAKTLRDQGFNLELITPLQLRESGLGLIERKLSRLIWGRHILPGREPSTFQNLAHQVQQSLDQNPSDLLFSTSTLPLSHLETKIPIVFWVDSNFASMINFYPSFSRLSSRSIRYGNQFEQKAITKSSFAIYSSDWARNSCLENYTADPAKVLFIPFGADLETEPSAEEIEARISYRAMSPCKLLYIGRDWKRKGGKYAIQLAEELNRRGMHTVLTLIGDFPKPLDHLPSCVHALGNINKSGLNEIRVFSETMLETHFLVLPTHANATPRVLNEANAFGIPCITTNVGGIASIIEEGVNGVLFKPDATFPMRAADCISAVMASESGYRDFARSSYYTYITKNNWKVSGKKIKDLLEQL